MTTVARLYNRPVILFNVKDRKHRQWAHQFIKDRSWKNCPVQFGLPIGEDNVFTMIQRELTRHYLQKEFGALPKTEHDAMLEVLVAKTPRVRIEVDNR